MINSIAGSLKKYAEFQGKATRKEFWLFVLFFYISTIIGGILDGLSGIGIDLFGNLVALVLFLPYLAVAVRRMHDVGKRGWFILVPFYNVVLACTPSKVTGQAETQSS